MLRTLKKLPFSVPQFFRDFSKMSIIPPQETDQYEKSSLSKSDTLQSPVEQFRRWFKEAQEAKISIPEALNLATAELPSGRVSVRVVLMKELDAEGNFVIYSNWEHSRKASDVASNPNVSLSFWWRELERTVRVEGTAERMTREESEVYFQQRPRGSQIGAWASKQSQPLESREELEQAYKEVEKRFEGQEKLPCPPFWGGIRITPVRWEFWQGRTSRVHDRIAYTKSGSGWEIGRVSP